MRRISLLWSNWYDWKITHMPFMHLKWIACFSHFVTWMLVWMLLVLTFSMQRPSCRSHKHISLKQSTAKYDSEVFTDYTDPRTQQKWHLTHCLKSWLNGICLVDCCPEPDSWPLHYGRTACSGGEPVGTLNDTQIHTKTSRDTQTVASLLSHTSLSQTVKKNNIFSPNGSNNKKKISLTESGSCLLRQKCSRSYWDSFHTLFCWVKDKFHVHMPIGHCHIHSNAARIAPQWYWTEHNGGITRVKISSQPYEQTHWSMKRQYSPPSFRASPIHRFGHHCNLWQFSSGQGSSEWMPHSEWEPHGPKPQWGPPDY